MKRTLSTVAFFLFIINIYSQDITPPVLNGFSFSPSTIDLSSPDLSIDFSISASDDSNEIKKITVSFSNSTGNGSKSTSFNSIKSRIFNYSGTITLPNNSEAGNWGVSISLEDDQRNRINYSETELSDLGFPSTLIVISTDVDITDNTPPSLNGFSFSPGTIQLPDDPVISFEVSASDEESGMSDITVKFTPESGGSKTERFRNLNDNAVTQAGSIDLGNNPQEGIWSVSVSLSDNEGNEITLSDIDLENLGFPASFEVISQSDETPPRLVDFSFTPSVINVDENETIVNIGISATDDISGLSEIKVIFEPTNNGGGKTLRFHNIDGNSSSFSGELDFKNGKTGDYLIEIMLEDNEKNSISYSSEELITAGFPSLLKLLSAADSTRPRLIDFSITPDTIEINSTLTSLHYFIKVENENSELKDVSINFEPPDKSGSQVIKFNNIKDKVLESEGLFELKKNTDAGEWKISIQGSDKERNEFTYTSEELSALGFTSVIIVKCTADILPPVLRNLSFSPDSVDITASDPVVSFSISVTDDLSGIDEIEISLGNKKQKFNKIDTTDVIYESSFSLGNNLSEGELEISVTLKDNEKNSISLSSEDLLALGFQNKIVIYNKYFVEITYPPDGEIIYPGNDMDIQWNHRGVKKVKLSYSTDNGDTWKNIANNINASRKSYKWTADISSGHNALFQITDDDNSEVYDMINLFISENSSVTGINVINSLPTENRLYQNYPNPFNPSTEIYFSLKDAGNVIVRIFNSLGEIISEPVNSWKNSGVYSFRFETNNNYFNNVSGSGKNGFSSGVYFYSIITKNFVATKKMLLIK